MPWPITSQLVASFFFLWSTFWRNSSSRYWKRYKVTTCFFSPECFSKEASIAVIRVGDATSHTALQTNFWLRLSWLSSIPQSNVRMLLQIRSWSLPFRYFPVHSIPTTPSFDCVLSIVSLHIWNPKFMYVHNTQWTYLRFRSNFTENTDFQLQRPAD